MIDAILTNTLLPELSRAVLNRSLDGNPFAKVTIGASAAGFTYAFECRRRLGRCHSLVAARSVFCCQSVVRSLTIMKQLAYFP